MCFFVIPLSRRHLKTTKNVLFLVKMKMTIDTKHRFFAKKNSKKTRNFQSPKRLAPPLRAKFQLCFVTAQEKQKLDKKRALPFIDEIFLLRGGGLSFRTLKISLFFCEKQPSILSYVFNVFLKISYSYGILHMHVS